MNKESLISDFEIVQYISDLFWLFLLGCVLFLVLSDYGLGFFGVYPEMLIIAYLVSEAWLFLELFVVSFMSDCS